MISQSVSCLSFVLPSYWDSDVLLIADIADIQSFPSVLSGMYYYSRLIGDGQPNFVQILPLPVVYDPSQRRIHLPPCSPT